MKFFIDTANLDEIREANEMGVLDGVTTNPTHISKEEGTFEEIILRICEVVDGPVSAEVISTEWEAMVEEARRVSGIHEQVVVMVESSSLSTQVPIIHSNSSRGETCASASAGMLSAPSDL